MASRAPASSGPSGFGHESQPLYRWKRQSTTGSGTTKRSTTASAASPAFSVSYHEKQGSVKKWIKSVDAAADQALHKHMTTQTAHGDGDDVIQTKQVVHPAAHGDMEDAITEANRLLSTYMASSSDPLAEVNLLTDHPLLGVQYTPSYSTKLPVDCADVLDPLDEAQLTLSAFDTGAGLLEIPHHSTTLDAFIPQEDQVQGEVSSVLNHLMSVPIEKVTTPRQRDPQIMMDARHMQVQEQSEKRRAKQTKKKEAEKISKDARKMIAEETRNSQAARKIEDLLLQCEVKKLRQKVKEEKDEIERAMRGLSVDVSTHSGSSIGNGKAERHRRRSANRTAPHSSTAQKASAVASRHAQAAPTALSMESKQPSTELEKHKALQRILNMQQRKVEEHEEKERLKLLSQVFSCWHSLVVDRQRQYNHTVTMLNWRSLFRHWTHWRRVLRIRQLKHEEEEATQSEIRKQRLEFLASKLYRKFLLRRCLWAWKRHTRQAQLLGNAQNDQDMAIEDIQDTKRRMEGLLHAIATGSLADKFDKQDNVKQKSGESNGKRHHVLARMQHKGRDQTGNGSEEQKATGSEEQQATGSSAQRQAAAPALITRHTALKYLEQTASASSLSRNKPKMDQPIHRPKQKQEQQPALSDTSTNRQAPGSPVPRAGASTSDSKVAQAVNSHKENGRPPGAATPLPAASSRESSESRTVKSSSELRHTMAGAIVSVQQERETWQFGSNRSGSAQTIQAQPVREKSDCRVAQKSAVLIAMEERTAAIAARKRQREQRQREAEEKRLDDLRRIDEERRRAEEAVKQALMEKRREERAKTKKAEQQKEAAQRHQQQLVRKAKDHYNRSLLKFCGMHPWKCFMSAIHDQHDLADKFNRKRLIRAHFSMLLLNWHKKESRRAQKAEDLCRHNMLKLHLRIWLKEIDRSRARYQVSVEYNNHALLRTHFSAWLRLNRDLKREQWEKERRAQVHNNKRLKCVYFQWWRAYIPLHRQEVEQEKRREVLRTRVSQWLPDYEPSQSTDS